MMRTRSGIGACGVVLLLATIVGGAGADSRLTPGKSSELVFLTLGGGNCLCAGGSSPVTLMTGTDGIAVPFALKKSEAIVITGGTIRAFGSSEGEGHALSINLFTGDCGAGATVERLAAVAGESGVSLTHFDLDLGLALTADSILCVAAVRGGGSLDVEGYFRGFRTKNK